MRRRRRGAETETSAESFVVKDLSTAEAAHEIGHRSGDRFNSVCGSLEEGSDFASR